MQASDVSRAEAAAATVAGALGLFVDTTTVLRNSNKLGLRLTPCDVFARVAFRGQEVAQFEVELAQRLAATESPVARLDPRVEPRTYESDGFVVTLWTYYDQDASGVFPADYADALARLHAGLRSVDIAAPHFMERVAEAQRLVTRRELSPALGDADRALLTGTLRDMSKAIIDRGAAEQLLHGEPHPGNVLNTRDGLRFIDLETCCRGPIEFDLAHVPAAVSDRAPNLDADLLGECRCLVLAMVAAWRWDLGDQLPERQRAAHALLVALRDGPPWPSLDVAMDSASSQ